MSLYYSASNTATAAANSQSVTVAGLDLTIVQPGMTVSFGSRGRAKDDAFIIASRTVNTDPTTGGTLTLIDPVPAALTNVPFVVDTRDFNGSAPNFALALSVQILSVLGTMLGAATNLFTGSRQVALDKTASGAVSRLLYAISGRNWFGLGQRATSFGGQPATESLVVQAFPDGTGPVDAITVNGATGAVDFLSEESSIASAANCDIGALNTRKVAITGTTTITGFGSRKHCERLIRFSGSLTLTHNAASLILPTGSNIVTAAGDTCVAVSDGSGNWRVRSYDRADGSPARRPAPISIFFSASDFSTTGTYADYGSVDFVAVGPSLVAHMQAGFTHQNASAADCVGRIMLRSVTGGVADIGAGPAQGITLGNQYGFGGNVKPGIAWAGLTPGNTYRLVAQFHRAPANGPTVIREGSIQGITF